MNDLMFTNSRDANFACSRMQKTPPKKPMRFVNLLFPQDATTAPAAHFHIFGWKLCCLLCVFTYAPHIIGAITLVYSGGGTPEIIIIERVGGSRVMSEGKLASAFLCSYDPYIVNKWDVGSLNAPYQPSKQPSSINAMGVRKSLGYAAGYV